MRIRYQDANGNSELGVVLDVSRDEEAGKLYFGVEAGNDGASYTLDIATHRDQIIDLAYLLLDAATNSSADFGFDGYVAGPWVGDEETGEEICCY